MRVVFTKIASISYLNILEFLNERWTEKEIEAFMIDVEEVVKKLESGDYQQYQKSAYKTRSALIEKRHVRMFFQKDSLQISVLFFFDMRDDPKKIPHSLKSQI